MVKRRMHQSGVSGQILEEQVNRLRSFLGCKYTVCGPTQGRQCDLTLGTPIKIASVLLQPRIRELRTQKLKSHLTRTQSLKVPPLKPGVGQYIAMRATLTARDFFLAYFYPSSPFSCIFFQNFSRFFLCWLWLTHGSCAGPQNKVGHPAGGRFPC